MNTTFGLPAAALLALAATSAASQTADELVRRGKDLSALIDASAKESALCKGYDGKVIAVAGFDVLAKRAAGAGEKDEFETTAQYRARQAAAGPAPGSSVVLALPTDRYSLVYDADSGGMTVQAGAFDTRRYSDQAQADLGFFFAAPKDLSGGTRVRYSLSERVSRTYTATNGLGISMKVSDVDRTSRSIYVDAPRLFSFAQDDKSIVLGTEAAPATARLLKQSARVALVLQLEPPYVFTGTMPGAEATGREPVHYTEHAVALVAHAQCGLLLDGQSRVLASVDAG